MKYILLFIQIAFSFSKRIVTNYSVPQCNKCVYFKKSISFPNFKHLAYCTNFGERDIVMGKISYHRALDCRIDENKCGIAGKCFHERKISENIFNNIIIPKVNKALTGIICIAVLIIKSIFS
jgi:hypothetical protein